MASSVQKSSKSASAAEMPLRSRFPAAASTAADVVRYEQEDKLEQLYNNARAVCKKLDGAVSGDKQTSLLKELGTILQECKTLIKDLEREARIDGMSTAELAKRKQNYVQELNRLIAQKKAVQDDQAKHTELIAAKRGGTEILPLEEKTTTELMADGRRKLKDTGATLSRTMTLVEDTVQIGTTTAATLHGQTQQLERVMDELDEIHFSMGKARKVLRDMTRGIATDKCIMFMITACVLAVVVVIVLQVAGVNKKNGGLIPLPSPTLVPPSPIPDQSPASGRRLLTDFGGTGGAVEGKPSSW